MADEYTPDLITLINEDGEEVDFEILDIIENDDGRFYVLFPYYEKPEDSINDPGEYYILQAEDNNGEEELVEIEDDELFDKIADIFEENYYSDFYDDDDED